MDAKDVRIKQLEERIEELEAQLELQQIVDDTAARGVIPLLKEHLLKAIRERKAMKNELDQIKQVVDDVEKQNTAAANHFGKRHEELRQNVLSNFSGHPPFAIRLVIDALNIFNKQDAEIYKHAHPIASTEWRTGQASEIYRTWSNRLGLMIMGADFIGARRISNGMMMRFLYESSPYMVCYSLTDALKNGYEVDVETASYLPLQWIKENISTRIGTHYALCNALNIAWKWRKSEGESAITFGMKCRPPLSSDAISLYNKYLVKVEENALKWADRPTESSTKET